VRKLQAEPGAPGQLKPTIRVRRHEAADPWRF
jgi:hypothetical protein